MVEGKEGGGTIKKSLLSIMKMCKDHLEVKYALGFFGMWNQM